MQKRSISVIVKRIVQGSTCFWFCLAISIPVVSSSSPCWMALWQEILSSLARHFHGQCLLVVLHSRLWDSKVLLEGGGVKVQHAPLSVMTHSQASGCTRPFVRLFIDLTVVNASGCMTKSKKSGMAGDSFAQAVLAVALQHHPQWHLPIS